MPFSILPMAIASGTRAFSRVSQVPRLYAAFLCCRPAESWPGSAGGPSFRVALEPLGVSLQGISPVQIGTHTADHVQTALLCSCTTLPEEITISEILAFAMKWHLRSI